MKTKTVSLRQCLELIIDRRGVTPKKLKSTWKADGYKVLSANNVKSSRLQNTNQIRFVDADTYHKWMKTEIEKNDILLTSEAPAGEALLWDSDEKIVVGQRLYALRVRNTVNPWYLTYYLQSNRGQIEGKKKYKINAQEVLFLVFPKRCLIILMLFCLIRLNKIKLRFALQR